MLKFFSSKFFGAIIFFFPLQSTIFFYSYKEDGVFFVRRNVSVLEGELSGARYCAEGTICNDRRSLQIQLGVWGAVSPPAGPGQRPGGGPGGSPRKL